MLSTPRVITPAAPATAIISDALPRITIGFSFTSSRTAYDMRTGLGTQHCMPSAQRYLCVCCPDAEIAALEVHYANWGLFGSYLLKSMHSLSIDF